MGSRKTRDKLLKEGRVLKTYNQWKRSGFCILSGETSLCRDRFGVALFTDKQVKRL